MKKPRQKKKERKSANDSYCIPHFYFKIDGGGGVKDSSDDSDKERKRRKKKQKREKDSEERSRSDKRDIGDRDKNQDRERRERLELMERMNKRKKLARILDESELAFETKNAKKDEERRLALVGV